VLQKISKRALADVCEDCGKQHFAYMATTEVWQTAGLSEDQPCCATCLAKRLGRELVASDFDLYDSPCNLFLPGKIPREGLMLMIRRLRDNPPEAEVSRVTDSVLKMRRKYPKGLTMWQLVKWTSDQFGVHWTIQ
jgi:hypothetical protein